MKQYAVLFQIITPNPLKPGEEGGTWNSYIIRQSNFFFMFQTNFLFNSNPPVGVYLYIHGVAQVSRFFLGIRQRRCADYKLFSTNVQIWKIPPHVCRFIIQFQDLVNIVALYIAGVQISKAYTNVSPSRQKLRQTNYSPPSPQSTILY